MTLSIEPKEIIDVYSTPIIQQTSFWSNVKNRQGFESEAFEYKIRNSDLYLNVGGHSYTQADFLMFYQYLNKEDYIVYLPYGPEVEPSGEKQGIFLEELSEILRSHLSKNCIALRYDLNWESHWSAEEDFDENGVWRGEPDSKYQEFQLNYNTCNWKLKKSNSNILPVNTILVDICPSEEEILGNMKPKTRYNIGLALRKRVEVRSVGIEGLEVWYKIYCETADRNGLNINDLDYFKTVFTTRMEDKEGDVKVELLIAYVDNKFKRGFGGQIYHQLGCWDYPLDEDKYKLFQAYEMNRQGYYRK